MANIEISTFTRNNDGNTYVVKDTNAIPLSGSSAISGDLIPSSDGTVNLGSSSKQFNIIHSTSVVNHSTGIELALSNANDGADMALCPKEYLNGFFRIRAYDGTTRQTLQGNANGTLTWNNKNIDCVEEQTNAPNGYIRYTNGIQICWGGFMNNNNIGPGKSSYTFPKAFNAEPRIIVTTNLIDLYLVTATANATTFSVAFIQCYQTPVTFTENNVVFDYIAIGTWK